ncbi:DUF839 domain-containing protein [Streptomyces sp. A1277]|nr:DUF839 domain-containing protein [Streptomyces sp. A1277]
MAADRFGARARITGTTPVAFRGPVTARHPALGAGDAPVGTLSNSGHGATPWGSYPACEENANSWFGTDDPAWRPTATQRRYGLGAPPHGPRWHEADTRFDLARTPNEPNRYGWVVETDPGGRLPERPGEADRARALQPLVGRGLRDPGRARRRVQRRRPGRRLPLQVRRRRPLEERTRPGPQPVGPRCAVRRTLPGGRYGPVAGAHPRPGRAHHRPGLEGPGRHPPAGPRGRRRARRDPAGPPAADRRQPRQRRRLLRTRQQRGRPHAGGGAPGREPARPHRPLAGGARHRSRLPLGRLPAGRRPGARQGHRPGRGGPARLAQGPGLRQRRTAVGQHRHRGRRAAPRGPPPREPRQQRAPRRRPPYRRSPPPRRRRDRRGLSAVAPTSPPAQLISPNPYGEPVHGHHRHPRGMGRTPPQEARDGLLQPLAGRFRHPPPRARQAGAEPPRRLLRAHARHLERADVVAAAVRGAVGG